MLSLDRTRNHSLPYICIFIYRVLTIFLAPCWRLFLWRTWRESRSQKREFRGVDFFEALIQVLFPLSLRAPRYCLTSEVLFLLRVRLKNRKSCRTCFLVDGLCPYTAFGKVQIGCFRTWSSAFIWTNLNCHACSLVLLGLCCCTCRMVYTCIYEFN